MFINRRIRGITSHLLKSLQVPSALSLVEIQEESILDRIICKIISRLKTGTLNINDAAIKDYTKVVDQLSIAHDILLKGERMVIPPSLIKKVVRIGHDGHQGIVKTKQLLRSLVWFPNMGKIIEKHIAKCTSCQASVNTPVQEPLKSTILPDYPWQCVDIDFIGPLPSGDYILVAIDEFTRFPEIFITKSTSYDSTVHNLSKLFSSYGIPEVIKSDNGPPFQSKDFKKYAKHMGFKHQRITPHYLKANGLVENFNRMIIKMLKICKMEGLQWRNEIYMFLLNYRATVHLTTGKSPAELFFSNRPFRTRLGNFKDYVRSDEDLHKYDRKQKLKEKMSADSKCYVKHCDFKIGDTVLLKLQKINKLTPNYDPLPYIIIEKKGTMVTAKQRSCSLCYEKYFTV